MDQGDIIDAVIVDDEDAQIIDPEQVMRDQHIAGLRAMAQWLEEQPAAEIPGRPLTKYHACANGGKMALLMRQLGGHWEKGIDWSGDFTLTRKFGPQIQYVLYTKREAVCRKVVKGTKTKTVQKPADPVRQKQLEDELAALPSVDTVETEEDVEWECPESLLELTRDHYQRELNAAPAELDAGEDGL
jgi:hypothetical protein